MTIMNESDYDPIFESLRERTKLFLIKYKSDDIIKKIDDRWNLVWIPMIPDIINELKIIRKDTDKGRRFHQYFIYAIILEFNLSDTDCQLTDEEFSEIIQVKNTKVIKKHLNDLMDISVKVYHLFR